MSSQYIRYPDESGGGGGSVTSVNSQTGVVVLTAADVNAANLSLSNLVNPVLNDDIDANAQDITNIANVGIGVASPAVVLDINSANVGFGGQLRIQASDYAQITMYNSASPTLGAANMKAQLYYDMSNNQLTLNNYNGGSFGSLMLQDSGGNIGMGVPHGNTPATKLEVVGTVTMTGFSMPTGASNGYVLTSNGSGVGTWQAGGGGGANTALSNLASTAVNASIIPATNNSIDLGSSTKVFANVWTQIIASANGDQFILFDGSGITLAASGAGVVFIPPPTYIDELHVNNDLYIVPGAANGYVLTSDGSGHATWQVPAAEVLVFTSTATVGGAASEAVTVTGLLATDTILSVSQKTAGGAALPILGWSTQINGGITVIYSADMGSGAIVLVAVKR